jgi:hypothetical protein
LTHRPPGHWLSAVQKHAVPVAEQRPDGEVTLLQLPVAHTGPLEDVSG